MIYLDNAATTYPKPTQVLGGIKKCMHVYGGNAGRGGHALSVGAAARVFECRSLAADMFGAADPTQVFFTLNTTYALNAVIKGLLKSGDHVLISDLEHNAVYRPIYKMAQEGMLEYDVFPTFATQKEPTTDKILAAIGALIRKNTRMLICTHSSNICSAHLPILEIGKLCHDRGVLFVVDGAQSAGHDPINVTDMHIDALCLPGHKGLYGPQGTGLVVLGQNVELQTIIEGGNGVESLSPEMSLVSPERYEAGTVAAPCIYGLYEGMRAVLERGIEEIAYGERALSRRLCEALGSMRGVSLYVPWHEGSVVLFNVDGAPSEGVAEILNDKGICVRAGFHCAALAHMTLSTPQSGAVRASFGMFNTGSEVERLIREVRDIAKHGI